MASALRIASSERGRFLLLAVLLFINAMVLESNEVVATSGFISNIGVEHIVIVWAIDMTIIIITSGIYSLFVDRTNRVRLGVGLYTGFCVAYLLLYMLFTSGPQGLVGYGILLVINDQQWLLFPLVIWTLANDVFTLAEAKRLFPALAIAAFSGGIVGNSVAAGFAQIAGSDVRLLLFNATLLLLSGGILYFGARRVQIRGRRALEGEKVLDSLREGVGFVREVPIFRYLTLAMVLLGIGLNAIEFDFLRGVSNAFGDASAIQTFYGLFKVAVTFGLLLLQGVVAGWLLNRVGFKYIFMNMPLIMLGGVLLAALSPSVIGVIIGNYLVRITKVGVDEPSSKAFQGLVPDERRGRVSAFLDGYLYPLGSVLGCIIIGTVLILSSTGAISTEMGRYVYLGVALAAALIALWATSRIRVHYDTSMLNWRLSRRKRSSSSALEKLQF
jgi:ATP/ADP translocase